MSALSPGRAHSLGPETGCLGWEALERRGRNPMNEMPSAHSKPAPPGKAEPTAGVFKTKTVQERSSRAHRLNLQCKKTAAGVSIISASFLKHYSFHISSLVSIP